MLLVVSYPSDFASKGHDFGGFHQQSVSNRHESYLQVLKEAELYLWAKLVMKHIIVK
jgi:hypothetical protein